MISTRFFGIVFEPDRKTGFIHFACRQSHYSEHSFSFRCHQLPSVEIKKNVGGKKTRAFVAIDKRMVLNDAESIYGRQRENGWFPISGCLWLKGSQSDQE